MEKALLGLVSHIKTANITNLKTVDDYQGQLKDVAKLRNNMPAAYVLFMGGSPFAVVPELRFDIITVTSSKTYNRKNTTNLSLADTLGKWLRDNFAFIDSDTNNWHLKAEEIEVETVLTDQKYNIITIQITVYQV